MDIIKLNMENKDEEKEEEEGDGSFFDIWN